MLEGKCVQEIRHNTWRPTLILSELSHEFVRNLSSRRAGTVTVWQQVVNQHSFKELLGSVIEPSNRKSCWRMVHCLGVCLFLKPKLANSGSVPQITHSLMKKGLGIVPQCSGVSPAETDPGGWPRKNSSFPLPDEKLYCSCSECHSWLLTVSSSVSNIHFQTMHKAGSGQSKAY